MSAPTSIGGKTGLTSGARAKEVREFWTPERMKQAIPMPTPVVNPSEVRQQAVGVNLRAGEPGSTPPASPSSDVETRSVSDSDALTVGKLFYEDPTNNQLYSCSAAVLNAPNQRTVQTAGHCIHDPERDVRFAGHIFVPGYDNNNAPYDVWDVSTFIMHYKWVDEGKFHFDYAFMRMVPQSDGTNIQYVVGGLGFAWNQNNDFVDIMGYPATGSFNGERQKRDFTNTTVVDFVEDGSFEGYFDRTISEFGPGSSGGPLVREYNTSTRLGLSRGVNSFRFINQPYVFSPYFDGDAKVGKDFAGE